MRLASTTRSEIENDFCSKQMKSIRNGGRDIADMDASDVI
jgi:hypothetical protein